jgi:hypothetical protein
LVLGYFFPLTTTEVNSTHSTFHEATRQDFFFVFFLSKLLKWKCTQFVDLLGSLSWRNNSCKLFNVFFLI